jgi:tRNA dimethylallyltransferase
MIHDGLVAETVALIEKYGTTPVAFDAIGYREIIDHLNGTLSFENAIAAIKLNTWHYAKRQMTWFKKSKVKKWVASESEAVLMIRDFLK